MTTNKTDHLYLHVPFCRTICYYCDFCHRVYRKDIAEKWLERVKEEIQENCEGHYETVYLGGGTPTCLTCEELDCLLSYLDPFTKGASEYTSEANPESLDEEKIHIFKKHGVNRISLGIQSSDEKLLKIMNRHHSFDDVRNTVELLKKNGLTNISGDLMYSLPFQTMDILKKTLDDVLSLDLPHLSIYSLTLEENSVFAKKGYTPLEEDMEADMYEYIAERLKKEGYIHYEVSNFAKEGYESKHNLGYWRYDDFLGISMGAASKIGNLRFTNTAGFEKYFHAEDIREEVTELTKEDEMFENVMMSLRTLEGLDLKTFEERYGVSFEEHYQEAIRKHSKDLVFEKGRVRARDLALLHPLLIDFLED